MSFRISKSEQKPIEADVLPRQDDADLFSLDEELQPHFIKRILGHVLSSPYDYYLSLNEDFELIDWDKKAKTVAWPLGSFCTLVFFSIRLIQDNVIKPKYNKANKTTDSFDLSRSSTLRGYEYFAKYQSLYAWDSSSWYTNTYDALDKSLKVLLLSLLLWNTVVTYKFLFGTYQKYSLFYLKERLNSKNATKRSLSHLTYRFAEDAVEGSLWTMLKYIFFQVTKDSDEDLGDDFYYEIQKWSPSSFTTCLFVSFSPITVCFLMFSDVSFVSSIPVILNQYILWFIIFERYENRIIDEQVIYKGASAEIDAKLIKPKRSIKTQDALVDATTFNSNFVQFYPSYTTTRSKIFGTHSLSGELIKEKYNPKTQRFEDLPSMPTNNVITELRQDKMSPSSPYACTRAHGIISAPTKYLNNARFCTPSSRYRYPLNGFSSISTPSTPLIKNTTVRHNGADYSMIGNVSKGMCYCNTCSKHDSFHEHRRRNSTSPSKKDILNPMGIMEDENSSHCLPNSPAFDQLTMDDIMMNGSRPGTSIIDHKSDCNEGHGSSRNSSISPFKLSRRGSVENRSPFR